MSVRERDDMAASDEQRLAELGYKQELSRSWSGFQNFAISFTIISILAGCFTTYGQAWNNGGPIAISWGWPLISIPILIIGFCMSELVSAYPTAGGIYWWASKLGGGEYVVRLPGPGSGALGIDRATEHAAAVAAAQAGVGPELLEVEHERDPTRAVRHVDNAFASGA